MIIGILNSQSKRKNKAKNSDNDDDDYDEEEDEDENRNFTDEELQEEMNSYKLRLDLLKNNYKQLCE